MTDRWTARDRRGVVVTGGTSGIGLAIALRLSDTGRPVVLLARRATERASPVFTAFHERGSAEPQLIDADVTEPDRLREIAKQLTADGLDIGIVVASAGTNVRSLALDVDDTSVRAMIDTNLSGVFWTMKAFAPMVLDGPDGRFIALSSLNAVHGMTLRAPYSATKAGVSGLVRALAMEWSPLGATVNALAPGVIETPLTAQYMAEHPDRAEALRAHTPVGRLGAVGDVAHAAEFLASPESGFITGQTLVLDGGLSAGSSWW